MFFRLHKTQIVNGCVAEIFCLKESRDVALPLVGVGFINNQSLTVAGDEADFRSEVLGSTIY